MMLRGRVRWVIIFGGSKGVFKINKYIGKW